MSRYDSVETTYLIGALPTGGSVTIQIYRVSTGVVVTGGAGWDVATEIATTGIYKWLTSGVTWPANDIYLYRFTDGVNATDWFAWERGLGYPETVRTKLDSPVSTRAIEKHSTIS